MSYEVTELEENYLHKAITRSGEFNCAAWDFTLIPNDAGTTVTCLSRFSLRRRFVLLAPRFGSWAGRASGGISPP
jgi:hypothetical protein